LLPNGKILVAGGYNVSGNRFTTLDSAELYDPATGTWSLTGNLNIPRTDHAAALLPNGKVLVAGGYIYGSVPPVSLNSAELYDPTTGTWSVTANLGTPRRAHTATLLPNGKVLVAGGDNQGTLASAELFTFNTASTTVDFTGDGISDIGIYRNGTWFIRRSSDGGITTVGWGGLPQDRPVPADYEMETGKWIKRCIETASGSSYVLPMEVRPQPAGAERRRTDLYRQTMMGMGRRI
jgi:hypothetical protein